MLCDLFICWYVLTKNQCLSLKSYFGWFGILEICLNLAPSLIRLHLRSPDFSHIPLPHRHDTHHAGTPNLQSPDLANQSPPSLTPDLESCHNSHQVWFLFSINLCFFLIYALWSFYLLVYPYKKSVFELKVVFWLIWDSGNMLKFSSEFHQNWAKNSKISVSILLFSRIIFFSNSLSFLFLNVRIIYISVSYSIRLLHRKWKKLRSPMASRTRFFWYTYLNDSESSFQFFWALNKLFL